MNRIFSMILVAVLALAVLVACGVPAGSASTTDATASAGQIVASDNLAEPTATVGSQATAATVLAENSPPAPTVGAVTDTAAVTQLTLAGATISVAGAGVTIDGGLATISAGGTYRLSGTLDDGQILVDSSDDAPVRLILDGVTIVNSSSAPIYIKQAQAVEIVLADESVNTLTDATEYVYAGVDEDEPNAALFSDDTLLISGNGSLTVNANYNDGITSKDGLTIAGGTIQVTAADDGIRGKDYLIIKDGALTIAAGGDGFKSDNADDATLGYISIEQGSIVITAGGDGIQAETDLVVTGGAITVTTGGGSDVALDADLSAKGLKAVVAIVLDGGTVDLNTADDGIHADGDITINGGVFRIATGDDGIHADANVTVNGGDIQVAKSYEGLEGAHIVVNAGAITLVSSDDAVNAAGDSVSGAAAPQAVPGQRPPGGPLAAGNFTLAINGGVLLIDATGDGVDVNGAITMTDGLVIVNGPTMRMNAALDYDRGFSMSGGVVVAVGSAGMAVAPDETSTQNALLLNFSATQAAGTLVHIQNSAGEDVLTFLPTKAYQSLAFSSPALTTGESYQVYLGGSASGDLTYGLYRDATYTPGAEYTSFTVSSVLTKLGVTERFR